MYLVKIGIFLNSCLEKACYPIFNFLFWRYETNGKKSTVCGDRSA